jgi:hypothetical protein
MEKKYFLAKLIPPRPSFTTDMTAEERQVMMDHGAYLRNYVEAGTVIVMGPVLDPAGSWGLAVFGPVPRTRSGPSLPAIPPSSPGSAFGGRFTRWRKLLFEPSAGRAGPPVQAPLQNSPSEKIPQKRVTGIPDRPLVKYPDWQSEPL